MTCTVGRLHAPPSSSPAFARHAQPQLLSCLVARSRRGSSSANKSVSLCIVDAHHLSLNPRIRLTALAIHVLSGLDAYQSESAKRSSPVQSRNGMPAPGPDHMASSLRLCSLASLTSESKCPSMIFSSLPAAARYSTRRKFCPRNELKSNFDSLSIEESLSTKFKNMSKILLFSF